MSEVTGNFLTYQEIKTYFVFALNFFSEKQNMVLWLKFLSGTILKTLFYGKIKCCFIIMRYNK